MSDQGSHFINEIVHTLLQNFMIQHHKNTPYHLQANRSIEAFNKILEKGLTKVCFSNKNDWDEWVPTTLWTYRTIVERLNRYGMFKLVYGREVVPTNFIVLNIFISYTTRMSKDESLPNRVNEFLQLDESWFLAYFHHSVEKECQKAWHDHHIKKKSFPVGDQVLLYDRKYNKHPRKLQIHWLGPFYVADIKYFGVVQLAYLDGILLFGWVNNGHLKPYFSGSTSN